MTSQNLLAISLTLTLASLPIAAIAQTDPNANQTAETANKDTNGKSGIYGTVSGGVNFQSKNQFEGVQAPAAGVPGMVGGPAVVRAQYETGPIARAAIGYRWKKGLIKWLKPRTEIEVSRSRASVASGSFNGGNQTFAGSFKTTTVKLVLASDIRWSPTQTVVPFISSGFGVAIVDPNIRYLPINGIATAPTFRVGGNRTRFAQHNSIGVSYTGINGLDLYTEGRYSRVNSASFERRFIANDGFSASVRDKTQAFEVTVGTRLRF